MVIKTLGLLVAAISICAATQCGGGDTEPAGTDAGPGDHEKARGEEGGPCYPNGTCNSGLTCASGLCVDLPAEDAGLPDTAGDDTGGVPDSGDRPDAGEVTWSVSGTVRLNLTPPGAAANDVEVGVLTAPVGANTTTIALVKPDANGLFSIGSVPPGRWYLYASYQKDGFAAYAAHPANPVIVDRDVEGMAITVLTVSTAMGSAWAKEGAFLLKDSGLTQPVIVQASAAVFDPANGQPVSNALVELKDGATSIGLEYDAGQHEYLYQLGVSQEGPFAARETKYTWTIQHALFAGTVNLEIEHHPMTVQPVITAPAPDTAYGTPVDVTVDWNDAAGADAWWAWVFDRSSAGMTPAWEARAEDGTLTKPLLIPKSVFQAGLTYEIGTYVGRETASPSFSGRSAEMAMSYVNVSF